MPSLNNNADIRGHAMGVTKRNFGKIFLMNLIVGAIPAVILQALSLIFNVIISASVSSMTTRYPYYGYGSRYASSAVGFLFGAYAVYMLISLLVSALITPALTMGQNNGILHMIRDEQTSVGAVFSRFRICIKGFLLTLFIGLRTMLWALPGFAVILLAAVFGTGFGLFLLVVGYILIYALIIPAAFRYCMAIPALADDPDLGVLEAFNRSKDMMEGRKWQYFRLLFLYGLILLGAVLAVTLLATLLAKVSIILSVLIILPIIPIFIFISMLTQVASLTFYDVYSANA